MRNGAFGTRYIPATCRYMGAAREIRRNTAPLLRYALIINDLRPDSALHLPLAAC